MEAQKIYKYKSLQKPGRYMTLFDERIIKGGDFFESTDENIPKGFRDLIQMVPNYEDKKKLIPPLKRTKKVKTPVIEKEEVKTPGADEIVEKEIVEEQEPVSQADVDAKEKQAQDQLEKEEAELAEEAEKAGGVKKEVFEMKHIARGRYNVYNSAGAEQSTKLLLKAQAELLLEQLNTAE